MLPQIMTGSNTNEVGSVSIQIAQELKSKNWTPDPFFLNIITNLDDLVLNIQAATGIIRKGTFTLDLLELDAIFDRSFLQLKHFVSANIYSLNEEIAKNAKAVMAKFEAYDANLYRLGYSEEIFLAISLINELKEEKIKALVDSLPGVPEALNTFETNTKNLNEVYKKSKADSLSKNSELAASELKNVIRDIINFELVPYLMVMKKKDEVNYASTADLIFKYITDSNTAVKTRLTRNSNQVEEPVVPEEN